MEETLKERIQGFGLSEDEKEYLLSQDTEILARLASISKDYVLREIVYSLIDKDIMDANYSDEVILTFINACVCNFAYEAFIFKALAAKDKKDEEEILYELKLLARIKDRTKIKSIISLYQVKDLPLKNEFTEVILTAKSKDASEGIADIVTNYWPDIQKDPYYYLTIARIIANVKKKFSSFIYGIISVAKCDWVIKNNCLEEIASIFLKVTHSFQMYIIIQLFCLLNEDSSIKHIYAIFEGANLILQCDKKFQAELIFKCYEYSLRNNIDINFADVKSKTSLTFENRKIANFTEENLKERIKEFGLSDDKEEYLLSQDTKILARLASIPKDDVLRKIVYRLVGKDIRNASYSDEVILTFVDACVCNFACEASIFEVLANKNKQDEEEIIYELKLLSRVEDRDKVKSIKFLYQINNLPLKNEFAETILKAKFVDSGEEIAMMVTNNLPNTRKNPYYYLTLARAIANINKGPELTKTIVRNVIDVAENEWVIKNNCLDEVISKFLRVTQYFHSYGLCQLFRRLDKDSSLEQIEAAFKCADFVLECDKEFKAKMIWNYFINCLRNNLDIDFSKFRILLNVQNPKTSYFIGGVLYDDSLMNSDFLADTIDILDNSRKDFNFEYAKVFLQNHINSEYRLSAAQIINEVTEEDKINIINSILRDEKRDSLEMAAIANTLYNQGELEAILLLNHSQILNTMGVSILMARIIGRTTDYAFDIRDLREILTTEGYKEKVVEALKEELKLGLVSDSSLVADVLNQVLGTVINANFELVEEEENPKKNQTVLKRVFTKFKKNRNINK